MDKRILVLLLAALCLAAYAPSLSIPLMEDDYGNLSQALKYGQPSGFAALMHDATFRLRATSYWAMWLLWQSFHVTAWGYHAASLLLHIANTLLLYALAASWPRTRAAAPWTAAFFAVYEGHQEAVMWFSAVNELLMFLFGAASLVCWVRIRRPAWRVAASAVLFGLALISKESALVLLPLFLATGWSRRRPVLNWAGLTLPHFILAILALASVVASQSNSFRFSDGSFSLAAPFWVTWPRGMARLLWPWGWISLALMWGKLAAGGGLSTRPSSVNRIAPKNTPLTREPSPLQIAALLLVWMALALLPYSFLTYSTQIPSRQTYLASAGVAILAGLALANLRARPAVAMLIIAILTVNLGFLWVRKRRQFLERAAPTEQLIRVARETKGPIWMRCFPRTQMIAETAVEMAAGRKPGTLIWDEATARRTAATEFCYPGR